MTDTTERLFRVATWTAIFLYGQLGPYDAMLFALAAISIGTFAWVFHEVGEVQNWIDQRKRGAKCAGHYGLV